LQQPNPVLILNPDSIPRFYYSVSNYRLTEDEYTRVSASLIWPGGESVFRWVDPLTGFRIAGEQPGVTSLKPVAGKQYKLEVRTSDGALVTAATDYRPGPAVKLISMDTVGVHVFVHDSPQLERGFRFMIPASDTVRYYKIEYTGPLTYRETWDFWGSMPFNMSLPFDVAFAPIINEGAVWEPRTYAYYATFAWSTRDHVGKEKEVEMRFYTAPNYVFVYEIDEAYFKYVRSVSLASGVGKLPQSEPVSVHSNMKGTGIGIFGWMHPQLKVTFPPPPPYLPPP
jgi:hypothetical protein